MVIIVRTKDGVSYEGYRIEIAEHSSELVIVQRGQELQPTVIKIADIAPGGLFFGTTGDAT